MHKKSKARKFSVEYLYQLDIQNKSVFSCENFDFFMKYFQVEKHVADYAKCLCQGVMKNIEQYDKWIFEYSKNWRVERLLSTDRAILRLAIYEIHRENIPIKVVINEAIELAKSYGTKDSGNFVNGLLDSFQKDHYKKLKNKDTP